MRAIFGKLFMSAVGQDVPFEPPTAIIFKSPTLFGDDSSFGFASLVVLCDGVAW
jgi:hypothetical protein